MKILSLNTHSLVDSNEEHSIHTLASFIEAERPDIICLQEVNQPRGLPLADTTRRSPLPTKADDVFFVPYREGNFLLLLLDELFAKGINYNACWLPIKIGYEKFDEGLALLSFYPKYCVIKIQIALRHKRRQSYGYYSAKPAKSHFALAFYFGVCSFYRQ